MNFETYLNFKPNREQHHILEDLVGFIDPKDDRKIIVVKGAAGTGKTSIMKAISNIIGKNNIKSRLAAPTGRAAKVLYDKTNSSSVQTIHSMIYIPEQLDDGRVQFNLRSQNEDGHCIYIIDESSMISDFRDSGGRFITEAPLLTDLIRFVTMGDERNKIIFVGDHYQLPPVVPNFEKSISYALTPSYLQNKFKTKVGESALTKVMRQEENSDVLKLATDIRDKIEHGNTMYTIYPDSNRNWWHVRDMYLQSFTPNDLDKVVIICHTNKDVNWWNQEIRKERFSYSNNILEEGDVVSLHKNNWTNEGIIFNGDSGIVKNVDLNSKKFGGLHFSECTIEFGSAANKKEVTKLFCWEVLLSEKGELHPEQESKLYAAVMQSNPVFRDSKNIQDDKYLNALRLRYGYALTCHKAQGGEWDKVFVHPYLDLIKRDKARWLYTAYTRASKTVLSWQHPGTRLAS